MITELIQKFQLQPHPEGGWYTETYRSPDMIKQSALPDGFNGPRPLMTAIYFLLEQGNFSAFHRIKSDECWHFYAGQTLRVYVLGTEGRLTVTRLGHNMSAGEVFQYIVPANHWFASEPAPDADFSFMGCTVSPGFEFSDFELAASEQLIREFPIHQALISRLCRV